MFPNEIDILKGVITDQNTRITSLKEEMTRLEQQNSTLKTFVRREFPELSGAEHAAQPEAEFPQEFDTEEVAALLIKTVREKPGQTVGQIAKLVGLTTQQTSTLLQMLRKQSIIRSEGARRATRYFIA